MSVERAAAERAYAEALDDCSASRAEFWHNRLAGQEAKLSIIAAIRETIAAFERKGLSPPAALRLKTYEEGARLLAEVEPMVDLPDRLGPLKVEIAGVVVTWPPP